MPRLPTITEPTGPSAEPERVAGPRASIFGGSAEAITSASRAVRNAIVRRQEQQRQHALLQAENAGIRELDRIQTESLQDPATAVETYRSRAEESFQQLSQGIEDDEVAGAFRLRYERMALQGLAVVRNNSLKSLARENVNELSAQLNLLATRAAQHSGKARVAVLAEGFREIERLRAGGDIDDGQAEQFKQQFTAKADDETIRRLIRVGQLDAAERTIKTSTALTEADKLSLQRSVDASRRQGQAELVGSARDFITFIEAKGTVPEGAESVAAALRGTDAGTELSNAIEDSADIQHVLSRPLAEQADIARRAFDAASTPRQLERAVRIGRAVKRTQDRVKEDPLQYAEDQGIVKIDPLFSPSAISGGLDPEAVKHRVRAATVASSVLGVSVQPFKQAEIDMLHQIFTDADVDTAAAMMADLANALPPDMMADVATMLLPKDAATAVAFGAAKDDPRMARQILQGRNVLGQRDVPVELPSREVTAAAVGNVYGDLFAGQPATLNAHVQAAKQLYAKRRADAGDFGFDEPAFNQALIDVAAGKVTASGTVGDVIQFNGPTVPPERGMTQRDFDRMIFQFKDDDLVRFGNGVPVTAISGRLTVEDLQEARFVPIGAGKYFVTFPEEFPTSVVGVEGQAGARYVLDLRRAWQEVGSRPVGTIRESEDVLPNRRPTLLRPVTPREPFAPERTRQQRTP